MIEVRLLGPDDASVLGDVLPGVFDQEVDPDLTAELLGDPRHHLAAAVENGRVVAMASGLHYVHPDKAAELWINEVGVASTHRRRGLARALVRALFDRGRELGCRSAWVLTDKENRAALQLYAALGGVRSDEAALVEFDLQRS